LAFSVHFGLNKQELNFRLINTLLWLLPLFFSISFESNSQTLSNIQPLFGEHDDLVLASQRDASGNTYVSVLLGGYGDKKFNVHDSVMSNNSGNGAVTWVIKFNPAGQIQWINDYGYITVITINQDHLYFSGSKSQYSFVLVKANTNGEVIWKVNEGTSGGVMVNDMITDKDGNIYITGTANTWSFFGVTHHSNGCCLDHDYVLKFDPTGTLKWAIGSAADSWTEGQSLVLDAQGNLILGGTYVYTMRLGSFSLLENTMGYTNSYLASISSNTGQVNWLRGYGNSNGHINLADIEIDEEGSIYILGAFAGIPTLMDTVLSSAGTNYDLFITKLSNQNERLWTRCIGNTGADMPTQLVMLKNDILLSGIASGNVNLTGISLTMTSPKAVIARVSKQSGNAKWFKDFGASGQIYVLDFRLGYLINPITDNCFFLTGTFVGQLKSTYRTLEGPTPQLTDGFTGYLSEENSSPTINPDVAMTFCEQSEVILDLELDAAPLYYSILTGKTPGIDISNPSQSKFTNLDYGKTTILFTGGCTMVNFQKVTLERIKPPPAVVVNNPYKYCNNQLADAEIVLNGTSITWYKDLFKQNPIWTGDSYKPMFTTTLYVTQKNQACESDPQQVEIVVNQQPPQPKVTQVTACEGAPFKISAQGVNLKWYEDNQSTTPIKTDETFDAMYPEAGNYNYYVTQTNENCESLKSEGKITVITFNQDEFILSNVITPNGDDANEYFYIKPFESQMCLGEFQHVSIYNRWGNLVYGSSDKDFKWAGSSTSGTYFYEIQFELRKFKSTLSVIH
jgi:gliding motility-associated-like protein